MTGKFEQSGSVLAGLLETRSDFIELVVQVPGLVLQWLERLALPGQIRQARRDPQRSQLQRAERRGIGARRKQGGDHRDAAQRRREEFGKARPFECARSAFFAPHLRLGHERQQQHQWNGRKKAGQQRVAPGGVTVERLVNRQAR